MGLPPRPAAGLLVFWGSVQLGFNGFAMNPVVFAAHVRAPTLFLHGENDPRVKLAEVESIRVALAGPSELTVFPGAGHVGLYGADAAGWDSVVNGFLDRNFPAPPPDRNPGNQR